MNLQELNQLANTDALEVFLNCCFSKVWAQAMVDARPFESEQQLISSAYQLWEPASERDILEAFSHHPKIGDLNALRNKYAAKATAEQGQIVEASEDTLMQLQAQNNAYYDKFGFIFIVCATGKSADEMLALLNARLPNARELELQNGAREQSKITEIRLRKLMSEV